MNKKHDSKEREPAEEQQDDQADSDQTSLAVPPERLPDKLYLIPATNRPFFPAQVQPLLFNTKPWEDTLRRVNQTEEKVVGLCFIANKAGDEITPGDFPQTGCAVKIHNIVEVDDQIQFVALGLQRFQITQWLRRRPPFLVKVSYPEEEPDQQTETLKAYAIALINAIKELLPLNPLYTEELKNYLNRFSPREPSHLADFAAAITSAPGHDLQDALETLSIQHRMEKVLVLIRKEQEVAKLQSKISEEVNLKISKHQREFFLREQIKVIQKELGISKDDKTAELETFRDRLRDREIPAAAKKKIDEDMNKLAMLEVGSPEFSVTRNYLDWATSVPWGSYSDDNLDLKKARRVLDKAHAGLDDVKDRIIEFLAVGAYKKEVSGSILLLTGPPGVGKTSIGQSIATALNRKFYRFSLGGMSDESEIKGHRRTYIGAMPGKLVQALKEVDVLNPVIMLDEIDKIGSSYRGDPASALLEVLDPAQNNAFLDHYLDMRLDLSKVLFICTANQLDSIPGPLLDRMETLRLSGYITREKIAIAKKHLWPKLLAKAGLSRSQVKISDAGLRALIEGYAREAGVRQLDKLLARLIRKAVLKILEDDQLQITIGGRDLETWLGQPFFNQEKVLQGVGIVTGLAWTSMGGATLPVEASCVHNRSSGFRLTGKLGQVMKESAEISLSYITMHLHRFGGAPDFFDKAFIHLHVPEGATPERRPQCRGDHGQCPAESGAQPQAPAHGHDRRADAHRPCAAGGWYPGEGGGRPAQQDHHPVAALCQQA